MEKIIHIDGMSCAHCCRTVEKALNVVKGILDVVVDLNSKTARVKTIPGLSDTILKNTLIDAGYVVISIELLPQQS